MGALTSILVIAEEAGQEAENSNFLVPNGTFFVILGIFLIVLAVISKLVVPPVMKVFHDRQVMIDTTEANMRKADERFAAAQAEYAQRLTQARREASALRDEARAKGNEYLDQARTKAGNEVAFSLERATERFSQQAADLDQRLHERVEALSVVLASRILGVSPEELSASHPNASLTQPVDAK